MKINAYINTDKSVYTNKGLRGGLLLPAPGNVDLGAFGNANLGDVEDISL
jgi:hypothetical protein